jgi:hypothetical protein
MRKLSVIAIILFILTLFSCKKSSTPSNSNNVNNASTNWVINGSTYSGGTATYSSSITAWDSSTNTLEADCLYTVYDSINANKGIMGLTAGGGSTISIQFQSKPTNKSYSIESYSGYNSSPTPNIPTTDSTCSLSFNTFSIGVYPWYSYKTTDKINVSINNGKITASFSNLSLECYNGGLFGGNDSTYILPITGVLVEN